MISYPWKRFFFWIWCNSCLSVTLVCRCSGMYLCAVIRVTNVLEFSIHCCWGASARARALPLLWWKSSYICIALCSQVCGQFPSVAAADAFELLCTVFPRPSFFGYLFVGVGWFTVFEFRQSLKNTGCPILDELTHFYSLILRCHIQHWNRKVKMKKRNDFS